MKNLTLRKNGRSRRQEDRSAAAIAKRRSNPPAIFVHVEDEKRPWRDAYKRAHLRNKAGYVYLCWREGGTVKTFYLGKAPRKSPTASSPAAGGSGRREIPNRRGK